MKELTIYTDGSHFKSRKGSGRLGVGGVILKNNKELDEYSIEINRNYLKLYYDTTDCSNPTMEMLAVLYALWKFKKHIKHGDKITIKADYQGVKEWMTGKWKINKPYIQKIKDQIDEEIIKLGLPGNINFEWVKGHQHGINRNEDAYWNDVVDLLAKGLDHEQLAMS